MSSLDMTTSTREGIMQDTQTARLWRVVLVDPFADEQPVTWLTYAESADHAMILAEAATGLDVVLADDVTPRSRRRRTDARVAS
jgi:hypothetical protein